MNSNMNTNYTPDNLYTKNIIRQEYRKLVEDKRILGKDSIREFLDNYSIQLKLDLGGVLKN